MNLYFVDHVLGCDYDYNYGPQTLWQPYTPEMEAKPIKRLKGSKGHAFNSSYFRTTDAYYVEMLFWPEGFYALKDLILSGGNQAECGLIDGQVAVFRINPVAPECREPYPPYGKIAACRANDLQYFKKYSDSYFRLATQSIVDRVKALDLKGMRFVLRWDGQRSYPLLPE